MIDAETRDRHILSLNEATGPQRLQQVPTRAGPVSMVLLPLADGSAGYMQPETARPEPVPASIPSEGFEQIAAIIDAITTPIAVFDKGRRLRHLNKAFATFWEFDPQWLEPGLDEGAILDRLRTQGQLPSEADYRAWKAEAPQILHAEIAARGDLVSAGRPHG